MIGKYSGRCIVVAVVVAVTVGLAGISAEAQTSVGAKQHFVGVVNGEEGHAVLFTVCPGPYKGRTGPVVGGEDLQVVETAHGHGYTGPFHQIYAWFTPVPSGTKPIMVKFSEYGTPKKIPRAVRVPCVGKGTVLFSSCPYLAPCAAGFAPDSVRVKFENITA